MIPRNWNYGFKSMTLRETNTLNSSLFHFQGSLVSLLSDSRIRVWSIKDWSKRIPSGSPTHIPFGILFIYFRLGPGFLWRNNTWLSQPLEHKQRVGKISLYELARQVHCVGFHYGSTTTWLLQGTLCGNCRFLVPCSPWKSRKGSSKPPENRACWVIHNDQETFLVITRVGGGTLLGGQVRWKKPQGDMKTWG